MDPSLRPRGPIVDLETIQNIIDSKQRSIHVTMTLKCKHHQTPKPTIRLATASRHSKPLGLAIRTDILSTIIRNVSIHVITSNVGTLVEDELIL